MVSRPRAVCVDAPLVCYADDDAIVMHVLWS